MKSKICTNCKVEKTLDLFFTHSIQGYQSQCKQCQLNSLNKYWKTPRGQAYRKKYYQDHKELFAEATKKWRKANPEKSNQFIYNWYEKNVKTFVAIQDKYQSKIPPSVYCIKYNDEVVYVGKSRKPLGRVNIHLSTIKSATNLTKINKLHSYCGYDKSAFKYEYLEQAPYDSLLEREAYYEDKFKAKANYKRIFGKVKSISKIMKEAGTYKYRK